jgi:hypothetical protein
MHLTEGKCEFVAPATAESKQPATPSSCSMRGEEFFKQPARLARVIWPIKNKYIFTPAGGRYDPCSLCHSRFVCSAIAG